MHLSFNKLRTFSECALKYRFAYLERLPRPPIRSLAFHRRLHAALSAYHRLAKRDGIVREEELLEAYARSWGVEISPEVRESRQYQEGEEILRLYCRNENGRGRVPAYLEHSLRVPFGPHVLTGVVDRLDFSPGGGYSLIDYKLDRQLPERNEAEDNQQLSFYDLLVYEGIGIAPDDVRLYYLRHGIEQVSDRTRRQRQETVAWVEDTASRIEAESHWQPQEGEACRICPFWSACPAKTGQERVHEPVWRQGELGVMAGEKPSGPVVIIEELKPASVQTALPF